ncbi:Hypothetical protein R9X50_00118700 [Acrodontium crateriforme]|uniref:Uncharacterized protein n=1 Tax=Acrodontium crateriforme TaxID=150365 RepID=A0AAQ3LZA6_9PEZI|nr:Hypothetical protein R9X50_00118700 [Acrodontium crateriforme]
MASPMISIANDENAIDSPANVKPATDHKHSQASPRRVLGAVSPNVRNGWHNKPMAGSPLKRSFTAMAEDGAGFTYLKKRRVSASKPEVRQIGMATEQTRTISVTEDQMDAKSTLDETTSISMPTIEQPMPSPTEPNTPSSDGEDDNSRSSGKSFSSLINYNPSSQGVNLLLRPTTRAEMLKLRLRVAMYKVRTNQVEIPFADLHVKGSSLKSATSRAVEAAVAALREEARQTEAAAKDQNTSYPKLLPAPSLKPTAYSSRMIYEPVMRSSPPIIESPDDEELQDSDSTPRPHQRQKNVMSPKVVRKLSRFDEGDVSSSVVKGRVAEGLLGLRNAA